MLFVVCRVPLFVVRCALCIVCLLRVVFWVVVRCLSCAVCCLLFGDCWSLFAARWLLRVVCCWLLVVVAACCVLRVVCCVWFVV